MEVKRDLMLKFGVPLAISFAGVIYFRSRIRNKFKTPPPSSTSSDDQSNKVDLGRGTKLDNQAMNAATSASSNVILFAADAYEEMGNPKVNADDSNVSLSHSYKHSLHKDGLLLPKFQELKEFDHSAANAKTIEAPRLGLETPKAYKTVETDDYEQEIRHLKSKVKMLRESERNLEIELLEYYGLKEQETAVMELQNRLKINNMEAKLYTLKIESLQTDNQRLESQVSDHAKSASDLEAAKEKIKFLKKKLRFEAEHNREKILNLQQRVAKLLDQECKTNESSRDAEIRQKIEDLEKQIEDSRKSNLRLQRENSDLGRRLDATQLLASSSLEDQEKETLKEERERLAQENEMLSKEMEQLKAYRCADVEELVYIRWINACLRYELRNFQPPTGKPAARDLSKTLSPKSEKKAKKLILEYANTEVIEGGKGINTLDIDLDQWSSSQASSHTDPGDLDYSAVDFPSTAKPNSNKINFMSKFRKLLRGKGSQSQQNLTLLAEKTAGSVEDSDSPRYSSSNSTRTSRTEGHGIGFTTSSQSSSRLSIDFHRLNSEKEYDVKAEDSVRRSSDVGYTNKRTVLLGSNRSSNSLYRSRSEETEYTKKSDLMKIAEVLNDTRGAKNRSKQKVASDRLF